MKHRRRRRRKKGQRGDKTLLVKETMVCLMVGVLNYLYKV